MELREALTQIAEIRQQVARTQVFRGYRAATVAFSGVLALAVAGLQSAWVPDPDRDILAYLTLWVGTAAISMLVVAVEMLWRCWHSPTRLTIETTVLAIGQFVPSVLAGGLGSVAGATIWYYVGRLLGFERLKRASARYGRWMGVSPEDLDRAQSFFLRRSGTAGFLGRLVPAVRTLISVPAGVLRMPLPPFLIYSTIGTFVWTSLLAAAGYLLEGRYEAVEAWLNPVTNLILAAALVLYLYRVATFRGVPQT